MQIKTWGRMERRGKLQECGGEGRGEGVSMTKGQRAGKERTKDKGQRGGRGSEEAKGGAEKSEESKRGD